MIRIVTTATLTALRRKIADALGELADTNDELATARREGAEARAAAELAEREAQQHVEALSARLFDDTQSLGRIGEALSSARSLDPVSAEVARVVLGSGAAIDAPVRDRLASLLSPPTVHVLLMNGEVLNVYTSRADAEEVAGSSARPWRPLSAGARPADFEWSIASARVDPHQPPAVLAPDTGLWVVTDEDGHVLSVTRERPEIGPGQHAARHPLIPAAKPTSAAIPA